MANLKCRTRDNSEPKGKPRVYFCCHKDDLDQYFDEISNEVLTKQNCAIWFIDEAVEYNEDYFLNLKQMQLFVMPVTTNLLCTENAALNIEFKFAIENHIPVLPLMLENGLVDLFNKKCGELQFLDKYNADITAISYDEKLEKYLSSVLIGDELAEKIRAAFDAYVFLSYRKKDRKYAQELMHLIHNNDFCRDIAIWYDEFISPGENFNDSIKDALRKSELFVLTVTPNLVNEVNYIITTEYPMAREAGKIILPVELVPTDRQKLAEQYEDIPVPADAHNNTELTEALLESIKKLAVKKNDNSPEHIFLIGLAYLNGVDLEVDQEKAVELITYAGENGVIEAANRLFNMYLNGIGVSRNYDKATEWFCKKISILKENILKEDSASNYIELINEMIEFGDYCAKTLGKYLDAQKNYLELNDVCKKAYQKFETLHFKRKLGESYVYLARSYVDSREYGRAEERISEAYRLLKEISSNQLNEITDNLPNATLGQLVDYYASYNDLATLYEGLAEIAQKNNEYKKVEEYLLRCLEFRQKVAEFFNEHVTAKTNVAISCLSLTQYYQDRGDLLKAIAYYDKGYPMALEIANQTKNLYAGEVSIRFNMIRARIHFKQNENAAAARCYLINIAYLEASSLTPQMEVLKAKNYYHASKLSFIIQNYAQAMLLIKKYLYLCNKLYDSKKYGDIISEELDYLTECYIKNGEIHEAIEIHISHLKNKYNLYLETGSLKSAVLYNKGLISIGDVYLKCGKYNFAQNVYKEALKFAKVIKKYDNAMESYYEIKVMSHIKMAKIYAQTHKKGKEKKCLLRAGTIAKSSIKYARTERSYRQTFETYGKIGDWYKANEEHKPALRYYVNAIYLAEESIAVFRNENDKYCLASMYLVAGTIQGEKSNEMLRKSKKLWQELLTKEPESEKYKYGNSLVNKALGIDESDEVKEHEIDSDMEKQAVIKLTSDSGEEEVYEILDNIRLNGNKYIVLQSVDGVEDDVLILQVDNSNGEENGTTYLTVENDELLTMIFDLFRKRNKDRFNFVE